MTVDAVILAAGRGERFGERANKLLADLHGQPLIRHTVAAALASRARRTIGVTGHARDAMRAALDGLPVDFAHNPDFATGLASSLRAGVAAAATVKGVLVLLGDMPCVRPSTLDALIGAFESASACRAIIPVHEGRRGNPVLLSRALFAQIATLRGDEGAKRLLGAEAVELPVNDPAVLADVDTREDLAQLAQASG